MVSRGWARLSAVALAALVAAACGPTASPTSAQVSATTSPEVSTSSTGPQTETFTTPPPEPTGPETPQPPVNKPVINLAGPAVEGGVPTFSSDEVAQCGFFLFSEPLDEDVRVDKVSLAPSTAFVRDDAACGGTVSLCFDYVFPRGSEESCAVGIRWKPESRVTSGTAALTLSAVCTSRDDALCRELESPPPPDGVTVRFVAKTGLDAELPDTETPDTGSPDTSSPDTTIPGSDPPTESPSPNPNEPPVVSPSPDTDDAPDQ